MANTVRKYVPVDSPVPGNKAFRTAELSVILGMEGGAWHLSVAHPRRNPTWKELHDIRYDLLPDDVHMALILPPRAEYVNLHSHCFHLWQVPAPAGTGILVRP